ncbi:MAG: xanthine dehydrogenase family protein molybdopterin-binding subunit [Betaproteobacteria bacterium]|nr:MAG: xanthine dehydrogenase family protein molybdopterin-binding subunit [Betaproteobacteria bacterium]
MQFDPDAARFGSSRSQKRLEDDRLLTGMGQFSDDRVFAGQAWLALARSPHAHARIVRVELDAARAAPGVIAAWSIAELRADGVGHIPFPPLFRRADGSPMAAPPRTLLAGDQVFYVGQPVAAVIAESREQAQDAAERVQLEYDELPCVVDPRRALEAGAPQLWPDAPGNVAAEQRYGDARAVDAALAGAAHVTQLRLHNQRLMAFAVEPRSSIGVVENGRVTLYTQNQTPTGARDSLAAALGGQPADYRVIVGDIGGGFGMKTGLSNEDALVCHAARRLGRPVRWRAERSEEFLAAHMGRDQHYEAQLALDRDGHILALRVDVLANFGAVPVGSTAIIPLALGPKVQTTVYRVPRIDFRIRGLLTNTMATGAYRGAGRPEANYLMERLIEQAAREMNIDSAEIRRRNFVRESDFPFRTHLGDVYDAGAFGRMLDALLARADWNGFGARRAEAKRRGRLRGRGLASYLEWTGAIPTETVDIQVDAEGTVTVFSGTQAMGQGLETTYTQLIAEVLQIPIRGVKIVQGDTDRATGVGSVGSRSAFVGGSATVAAGRRVIVRGREIAAEALEAASGDIEYRDGRFAIAGTDRSITLAQAAAREAQGFIRVSATETPSAPSWPNGAQACEVEIDPETGEVDVVALTSVDDIGRIINHMIVEGQIHGGMAQGVGQALYEQAVYDPESGQLLTGSLMDYCVPRADQFPALRVSFDESVPCKTNLLGVKGCGEIGTIGAVPAAVHAVLDALEGRGAAQLEMPFTPEKIWRALQGAGQPVRGGAR